jgi:hypothetical protein
MMTSLSAFAFGQFSWLLPILILAILLVAVVVALCRKDHVKTAIWMRSSGFFLEGGWPGL